jgi:hypothetical protein
MSAIPAIKDRFWLKTFEDDELNQQLIDILAQYDLPFGKITGINDYEIYKSDDAGHPIDMGFGFDADPEFNDGEYGSLGFGISVNVDDGILTIRGGPYDDTWTSEILLELAQDLKIFVICQD